MDRTEAMERHIAHLTRSLDELSDVVSNQAEQIERLSKQVAFLMDRARSAESDGGIFLGDERPPHY